MDVFIVAKPNSPVPDRFQSGAVEASSLTGAKLHLLEIAMRVDFVSF